MSSGDAKPDSGTESPAAAERLDSWKEIASYLKRSVRTVTRWKMEQGLPVHRHKTGTVYAYKTEVDTWWTDFGQKIESESAAAAPATTEPSSTKTSRRLHFLIPTLGVGLLLLAALAWFMSKPHARPQPKLVPLTTWPGIEGAPSLSPDGNQVAFVRNGDVFVKQVDGEGLVQLTSTVSTEDSPVWSPDGRQIAFRRDGFVFTTSPLGGAETRIAETRRPNLLQRMAWTSDAKSLILSELTSPICASLFMVSVSTGEKTRLTWPPEPSIGDGWPAVSPDGRTLAFARYPQDSSPTIHLLSLSGGGPRRIRTERSVLFGMAWTPDGNELVFSSDRSGASRLWRIPARSSEASPVPVEGAGDDARFPSFSRPVIGAPARLAYQRFEQNFDIRRAAITGEGTARHIIGASSPFVASTRAEAQPQYSPDGTKIAFVSGRSGSLEIWLCDSDGTNLLRLTSMSLILVSPRWSPDSRRIGFFATTGASGKYQNYVVDAAGGSPQRLSKSDTVADFLPTWSRDGRSIYFGSARSGTVQLWRMPAEGGEPVRITKQGGADSRESPDGQLVYYTKLPEMAPGLWSMPSKGGEEVHVLDSPRFGWWSMGLHGIYYIDFEVPDNAPRPVRFYSFEDHGVAQIGTVEKSVSWRNPSGFAISPDSRWLLYTNLESVEADLMLVDNFR
jgi:Tol biopolymer transport system component